MSLITRRQHFLLTPRQKEDKGGICSFLKPVFPEVGYLCSFNASYGCERENPKTLLLHNCSSFSLQGELFNIWREKFGFIFCFPGLTSSNMHHGALLWVWKKLWEAINLKAFYYFSSSLFSKHNLSRFFRKEKERKLQKYVLIPFPQILTAQAVIPCLHLPGFCAVLQHLLNPVSINRTFQSYLATRNFTDKHAKTLLKETVWDCLR